MWAVDQPEKTDTRRDDPALRIGPHIKAMTDAARQNVLLISAYFVPDDVGTRYLTDMAGRSDTLKVPTNSLASTDEPAVYAGYSHHRRVLLAGGVQLYEMRRAAHTKQRATARGRSSGVGLHAKAIVVDGREFFVGSMNMDQRSKLLNAENGIIVDSPALAAMVTTFFDKLPARRTPSR